MKLKIGKKRIMKIKAPDFKKMISRNHLELLFKNKKITIPFTVPNYKLIRTNNQQTKDRFYWSYMTKFFKENNQNKR